MINKKVYTSTLAMTMVVALSLTACGKADPPVASTTPTAGTATAAPSQAPKEPVTLTIWSGGPMEPSDAIIEEIKKKLNITIKWVVADKTKQLVQITSGDVPDLVWVEDANKVQLMNAKLLLPLDDLVKTNGKNLTTNLAKALEYSKKFTNSDGKLYVIPGHTAPSNSALANAPAPLEHIYGGLTRWDYYKELGLPVVKNTNDYLNLLADMVKKHPQTADGKKTYGIGLASDFALWEYNALPTNNSAKWPVGAGLLAGNDGVLVDQYADENAPFFGTSVKFYNKAYQMGLLDPESFTQKADGLKAKIMNGQVMSWTQGWFNAEINAALQKVNPSASMVLIPGAFPTTLKGYGSNLGYVGTGYGIAATSKHPDRAMDLLNYFASYEGSRLTVSGVKGQHWDLVNGKPEMKPEVVAQMKSDPDFVKKNGFGLNTVYASLMLIDSTIVNPEDGAPINLSNTTAAMAALMTPGQQEYAKHFGGSYPGEAYEKAVGKEGVYYANPVAQGAIPIPPDDIARINTAITNSLTKGLPKIVMSKTDAEYSENVKAQIAELKRLGLDTANAWYKAEYEKAKVAVQEYIVK